MISEPGQKQVTTGWGVEAVLSLTERLKKSQNQNYSLTSHHFHEVKEVGETDQSSGVSRTRVRRN